VCRLDCGLREASESRRSGLLSDLTRRANSELEPNRVREHGGGMIGG
jgi:hypothetical protein